MKTEISVESKHQTLQGLAFPLQPEAQRALQQLKQKTVNYIQLVGTQSCPAHASQALWAPPVSQLHVFADGHRVLSLSPGLFC